MTALHLPSPWDPRLIAPCFSFSMAVPLRQVQRGVAAGAPLLLLQEGGRAEPERPLHQGKAPLPGRSGVGGRAQRGLNSYSSQENLEGGEEVELVDPNTLREDGTAALMGAHISDDGSKLAYFISYSGSDWQEIHVK
jgi:hypothetical protein